MKAPENILDFLADCANVCSDDFPGIIRKRRFEGAHGPGSTADLLFTDETGRTYRITAELQPEPDGRRL